MHVINHAVYMFIHMYVASHSMQTTREEGWEMRREGKGKRGMARGEEAGGYHRGTGRGEKEKENEKENPHIYTQ